MIPSRYLLIIKHMKAYPAIITKEEDAYIVLFPDFNLMSTFGETYEEALEMGADALAGTLSLTKMNHEEFPKASEAGSLNVSEILQSADLESDPEAKKIVISVDVDEYIKKFILSIYEISTEN